MAKIRIEWKTCITETYIAEVDYEDFAKVAREHYMNDPDDLAYLEAIRDGATYIPGWNDLGARFEDDPESADVDDREIESVQVIED